jgi:hypothetical protein
MIGKIFPKSHGSFKNRIRYIFGLSKHDHAISLIKTIGGNYFSGDPLPEILAGNKDRINALVSEFDEIEKLRNLSLDSDKKIKPVFHAMLSLRPGEKLTARQWDKAIKKYMSDMGFTDANKYVAVLHEDTDHQHVHIVANRIRFEEKFGMTSDSNERTKNIESVSEIEDEYSLSKAPKPKETWGTAITHAEMQSSMASNDLPFKHKMIAKIAGAIEKTVENQGDMFMFVRLLRRQKVFIHLTKDENGQPKGIAYEFDGKIISGRQLKRSRLTWQKLTKQEGIEYEPETISALEREIAIRIDGEYEVTTVRTRYYVFVASRRRMYISFKSKDEELQEIINMILQVLLLLFGIIFIPEESPKGTWYQRYTPGQPFSPSFQDPQP